MYKKIIKPLPPTPSLAGGGAKKYFMFLPCACPIPGKGEVRWGGNLILITKFLI
jgi:hypothetical protein